MRLVCSFRPVHLIGGEHNPFAKRTHANGIQAHAIEVSRRVEALPDVRERLRIQIGVSRAEMNDRIRVEGKNSTLDRLERSLKAFAEQGIIVIVRSDTIGRNGIEKIQPVAFRVVFRSDLSEQILQISLGRR